MNNAVNIRKAIAWNAQVSWEDIEDYLKSNCKQVESKPFGWFVNNKYYITPYFLWRVKGKKGKDWYSYKSIPDLVEHYINSETRPWERRLMMEG